jgi:hypothetical protein
MIRLIALFFFSLNFSAEVSPLVSVKQRTATSGLLALSYFSYKYGPKVVAKKLPFILPPLGILAGLQNRNKSCTLISSGALGLSIFSHLAYTHRKLLISLKALPLYCVASGIAIGKKKKDAKIFLGSLGALVIYFVYSYRHVFFTKKRLFQFFYCALFIGGCRKLLANNRIIESNSMRKIIQLGSLGVLAIYFTYPYCHVLFTKKRLFQFFCCALFIGGGYKLLTDNRLRQIMNSYKIIKFLGRLFEETFLGGWGLMKTIQFSSLFSFLVIHDAIKNFVKKNNFFNKMPRSLLFSVMAYAPIFVFIEIINNFCFSGTWNSIKRPHWYDEAVSLKTKQTKCFYNQYEGRRHTATLCGRLEAQRVFDFNQVDAKSMKCIIGMIIMAFSEEEGERYKSDYEIKIDEGMFAKLRDSIKNVFNTKEELAPDEDWYWDEGVQVSRKRFETVVKLYFDAQKLAGNIDSEEFAKKIFKQDDNVMQNQIKEWATKEVIPGRVFDKEVSFEIILELINYMFSRKKFVKNDFKYIFSKEIDMRWKIVFDKKKLDNDDFTYIAMNMLYGIFCDTCTINFKNNFKTFQRVKKWCSGCADHVNKGFIYGPMTILEHMILDVKGSLDNDKIRLRQKLIELDIVKRSFFASIQL